MMKQHRFFIPAHFIKQNRVTLPADLSKQAVKVLRLKRGDQFMVLDNSGQEYLVELETPDSRAVTGKILQHTENQNEPETKITLYQALLPREKFELALQKGTEVGITKFVPIKTTYTIFNPDYAAKKLERWKAVIREAAKQSARGILPELSKVLDFKEALLDAVKNGPVFIAHPYNSQPLHSVIPAKVIDSEANGLFAQIRGTRRAGIQLPDKENGSRIKSGMTISIFVGPEGGFTTAEVNFAKTNGAKIISLGKRILRSETAGPILAALILYLFCD